MQASSMTVLFLSTGNAARSIMAEAILRARGSMRYRARSAGYRMAGEVHPETLALLQAEGIATDGLHSKGWGEFLASAQRVVIDVIVTLSEEARLNCPVWPNDPVRVHWTVDDPLSASRAEMRDWKFRKCFATLESRVDALIKNKPPACRSQLLLQLKDIGMVI